MDKKKSSQNLILIITTTVYSFSSMISAFFMLGSQSLIWFFISAFFYFIPYALIVAQYTKKYAHRSGAIYDWLKESLSPKAAFTTVFLWYSSYFIWMISLFMKLLIPISILIFGKDITASINWLGISPQIWLALLSILAVLFITWMNKRGFQVIFRFLHISGYAMVGLLILSIIGNLLLIIRNPEQVAENISHSISVSSFFQESSSRLLSQLPFFIFSITAFGGLDTIASLADKTKKSRTRFPRAVIISSFVVLLLYVSGIILWSCANNIEGLRNTTSLHLGNLMYGVMEQLAKTLAASFQLSASHSYLLTQLFIRYTALTMGLAYLSLLSSISYGPLKSLLKSTPKIFWPKFSALNKNQMPENALWIQAILISLFIGLLSFSNTFLAELFNQLTYMTNVSRAIPYFIVAASFPFSLKKNVIQKESLIIKNNSLNYLFSISVCLCIFVAIAFQIYEPLKLGNYLNFSTLLLGPVFFGVLSHFIYFHLEQKKAVLSLSEQNNEQR
ncbi:amino acid permease [Enterococcus hulanensis]|uniref:amino acid permease n=1 Tax=Enterococcus hulanensis TaxID=2559929 RepID=UPI00288EB08A|nr:amino acid permease [Enterococcus hulanensis]MDT2658706.1 amino acid permease [Enterococcus hulanensis]